MSLLTEFYSKMTNADGKDTLGQFEVAHRPLFSIQFTFDSGAPVFADKGNVLIWNHEDVKYVVQEVVLPKLGVSISDKEEGRGYEEHGFRGKAKGPGAFIIMPDDDISITFLDTQHSVVDYFFYPWMESIIQVAKNGSTPFPRATLYVDMYSNDYSGIATSYAAYGVYPKLIDPPVLEYTTSPALPKRRVIFEFNNMLLNTDRMFIGSGPNSFPLSSPCNTLKPGDKSRNK